MDTLAMVLVLLGNIVALVLVFYSYKKEKTTKETIVYSMFSIGVIYALTSITYNISSIGLNLENVSNSAKDFYTFGAVAINSIVVLPIMIRSYFKMKNKDLEKKKFIDRAQIFGVLLLGMLVCEGFFFRNVQNDLIVYANNVNTYVIENKENVETKNKIVENKVEEDIGENNV